MAGLRILDGRNRRHQLTPDANGNLIDQTFSSTFNDDVWVSSPTGAGRAPDHAERRRRGGHAAADVDSIYSEYIAPYDLPARFPVERTDRPGRRHNRVRNRFVIRVNGSEDRVPGGH